MPLSAKFKNVIIHENVICKISASLFIPWCVKVRLRVNPRYLQVRKLGLRYVFIRHKLINGMSCYCTLEDADLALAFYPVNRFYKWRTCMHKVSLFTDSIVNYYPTGFSHSFQTVLWESQSRVIRAFQYPTCGLRENLRSKKYFITWAPFY